MGQTIDYTEAMYTHPSQLTTPPEKLSWITVPLIINMVLSALSLLVLPFLGIIISMVLGISTTDTSLGAEEVQLIQAVKWVSGSAIWIIGLLGLIWLWIHWYTYQSLQKGKSVGRILAIILALLSLFNLPIGTSLGIFMLIGAFDADVQRYTSR